MNKFIAFFALFIALSFAAPPSSYPKINFRFTFSSGHTARGYVALKQGPVATFAEGGVGPAGRDITDPRTAVATTKIQETFLSVRDAQGNLLQEGSSFVNGEAHEYYAWLDFTITRTTPTPRPNYHDNDKKDQRNRDIYTVVANRFHISTLVSRGLTEGAQTPRLYISNDQTPTFADVTPSVNTPLNLYFYHSNSYRTYLGYANSLSFEVEY